MASGEEAMAYSRDAVERAMKVQEVILRAIDGQLTWVQAADILGCSPRTIRRIRWRLKYYGYDGLLDRRRQWPSPRRAPVAEVQRLLALYREWYVGFNVRHFHQRARREHGVRFRPPAWWPSASPVVATAAVGSRGPVSASSCISRQSPPLAGVAAGALVHPHGGGR
jgi:Homeodomain-like domain